MATSILIIGGDGDLAIRKLFPSLFSLELAGYLDDVTSVTAMGRSDIVSSDFVEKVERRLKDTPQFEEQTWQKLAPRLNYHRGDATSAESLGGYYETLNHGPDDNLIIYLAVPPKVFGAISLAVKEAGINKPSTRLVIEKPLGDCQQSFLTVDAQLRSTFDENQIYRIDHYLGKESVQNLLALRFSNIIFGSLWSSDFIDSIQITVAETVGVEGRKEFYNETGALKDMIQNHLLQIMCLVAMEIPAKHTAAMIREEKLKVLNSLKTIELNDINEKTVKGQYVGGSVNGAVVDSYQEDLGQESSTETYVAIKAEVNNWRWAGVPFYLRTGKRMTQKSSVIVIQFKPLRHNIFSDTENELEPNQIIIQLQPDSGMTLKFLNKRPGLSNETILDPLSLDLSASNEKGSFGYDAYARLMFDVIKGDQTLFISAKEVEASWKWVDKIIEHWDTAQSKTQPYQAGSMGPSKSVSMLAKDNREWYQMFSL